MKNKSKILIIAFALMVFFTECFAQTSETLKKGSFYSITLNNASVIQGKVMSFDSSIVLLKTNNGLTEIQRHEILGIKKPQEEYFTDYFSEYKKPVYRKYFSLNTGLILPAADNEEEYPYYNNSENDLNSGFDLSIGYTSFFGRNLGFRSVASFSFMSNNDYQKDSEYDSYGRTGGNLSEVLFTLDFLAGLFHPEKKINFYALAGIGLGQINGSNVTDTRTNYYYYEDPYTYTYKYNPELQWILRYGIGGGVTYRITDNFALQAELIYDHVGAAGGFYDSMNQVAIKAGVILLKF